MQGCTAWSSGGASQGASGIPGNQHEPCQKGIYPKRKLIQPHVGSVYGTFQVRAPILKGFFEIHEENLGQSINHGIILCSHGTWSWALRQRTREKIAKQFRNPSLIWRCEWNRHLCCVVHLCWYSVFPHGRRSLSIIPGVIAAIDAQTILGMLWHIDGYNV